MYREDMTPDQEFAVQQVVTEFLRASNKFPRFHSEHEGYAVLKEEVDELWDAIKDNKRTTNHERIVEAIQVGAMALRYVHDLMTSETADILDRGNDYENSN